MSSRNQKKNNKIHVLSISQSMVVAAYRSFFYQLANLVSPSEGPIEVALGIVAPDRFIELGGQLRSCEEFQLPFSHSSLNRMGKVLKARRFHVQTVLFRGLGKTIKEFLRSNEKGENLIFCMAEPYSITSLFVWLTAFFVKRNQFKFYCIATQNIYKDFPWPIKLIQRFVLKRCDGIFALGQEHEAVIRKNAYDGPFFSFPLWFNSELFRKRSLAECSQAFMQHSLPNLEGRKVLGFSGSLKEEKGILDLLTFLKMNQQNLKERYAFFVCGSGPLEAEVEKACKELIGFGMMAHFFGPLSADEMPYFFSVCDILVVPSRTRRNWKEQFGRIIIEAKACGCSVIGSDSGEIPVVIDHPDYIFSEGNLRELGRAIEHAASDLSLPEFKKQLMQKNFDKYSDKALASQFYETIKAL
ncbi:MAG: glycosyltransferase family 4 protein [Oligoflexales bacterium]|nr:glycosyltransferase family 4 protein [Oligoflexales bacterium]